MIWVIGCNGMLGTELCRQLKNKKIDFIKTGREIDVTEISALEDFVTQQKKIDFVINCAAYTFVDKAETEKTFAKKINVVGAKNVASVSKKIGAKIIHISTDYVFDGNAKSPILENEKTCPINFYGQTKSDGEKMVVQENDNFFILRTAWLYGWDGNNFVYKILKAANEKKSIQVVNDQIGSPTSCKNLSEIILKIVESKIHFGIYNFTDSGEISWFDFAQEIFNQGKKLNLIKNVDCVLTPCSTQKKSGVAERPKYSVLDKSKIQRTLDFKIADWKKSLEDFLKSDLLDEKLWR